MPRLHGLRVGLASCCLAVVACSSDPPTPPIASQDAPFVAPKCGAAPCPSGQGRSAVCWGSCVAAGTVGSSCDPDNACGAGCAGSVCSRTTLSTPCAPDGSCPSGQKCNPTINLCYSNTCTPALPTVTGASYTECSKPKPGVPRYCGEGYTCRSDGSVMRCLPTRWGSSGVCGGAATAAPCVGAGASGGAHTCSTPDDDGYRRCHATCTTASDCACGERCEGNACRNCAGPATRCDMGSECCDGRSCLGEDDVLVPGNQQLPPTCRQPDGGPCDPGGSPDAYLCRPSSYCDLATNTCQCYASTAGSVCRGVGDCCSGQTCEGSGTSKSCRRKGGDPCTSDVQCSDKAKCTGGVCTAIPCANVGGSSSSTPHVSVGCCSGLLGDDDGMCKIANGNVCTGSAQCLNKSFCRSTVGGLKCEPVPCTPDGSDPCNIAHTTGDCCNNHPGFTYTCMVKYGLLACHCDGGPCP